MIEKIVNFSKPALNGLNSLSCLIDLTLRLWVAKVFFDSGLTKIANMDSTVALFENEYKVPVLSPEIAAYLGTAAELSLPVFIALGLATRLSTGALFVFNIIAVLSYPFLLTEDGAVGLRDHIYWGLMMLVILLHGPGRLSIDHLIRKKYLP